MSLYRGGISRSFAAAIVTGAGIVGATPLAHGQTVQYRSPAGVEYRSQPDTGAIARAELALAADPRNVQRFIDLGVAQSGARQFREAIQTFTRGLAVSPDNALLLRWRGHRYLSVRDFDHALADLTRGARIDSTIYGIWYHLGIVRFVRGEFWKVTRVFGVTILLLVLATLLSVAATWGFYLIAYVPLAGVIVLPLQLAAWLLRSLLF
jgi:tetratricopeptide (TPR) repeat protein